MCVSITLASVAGMSTVFACRAEAVAKVARQPYNSHPLTADPVHLRYPLLPVRMSWRVHNMIETCLPKAVMSRQDKSHSDNDQRRVVII